MKNVAQKEEEKETSLQIRDSILLTRIKVLYGSGKNLPGTLDEAHHGMVYVIAGFFKTEDGEIFYGYPSIGGKVYFSEDDLSGEFTIYGKE